MYWLCRLFTCWSAVIVIVCQSILHQTNLIPCLIDLKEPWYGDHFSYATFCTAFSDPHVFILKCLSVKRLTLTQGYSSSQL